MTDKYKDIVERYSWDNRSTYVKALIKLWCNLEIRKLINKK